MLSAVQQKVGHVLRCAMLAVWHPLVVCSVYTYEPYGHKRERVCRHLKRAVVTVNTPIPIHRSRS